MASTTFRDPTRYQHQPLDTKRRQVRLLTFTGAYDTVHLEVRIFDLATAPPYRALTYTWGKPDPKFDVYLDGKAFEVRENLFAFLRKAKEKTSPIHHIWIDQICIDQSNIKERNHQVGLMSDIYSSAAIVTIWLGGTIGPYCDGSMQGSPYHTWDYMQRSWDLQAIVNPLLDDYFTRLWIVQELLLASTIEVMIRGHAWILWDWLAYTVLKQQDTLRFMGISQSTISLIRDRQIERAYTLGLCIIRYSSNLCGDPRDKVYGFLGLIGGSKELVVDYRKSIHEVFVDVALAFDRVYFAQTRVTINIPYPNGLTPAQFRTLGKFHPKDYYNILFDLSGAMGFTISHRAGLLIMLTYIWPGTFNDDGHMDSSLRSEQYSTEVPLTAMGFIEFGEIEKKRGKRDRWWCETQATKRYFECE
jgi:hypothetical protein